MADIEGIAWEIYDITISPDTVTGLINGGLSVSLGYGYPIYGIFDTDTKYERETERIRMVTAIRHDILNYENTVNAVKSIFQLFNKYLSESEQDRIYRSVVTSIVGRVSTNIIASNIAKAVIKRTSFTYMVLKGKGNPMDFLSAILLFGGMVERSIRTSDKFRNEAPEVYSLLRPHDYDLLYFLFAGAVRPFVDTIRVGNTEGNPVSDKTMKRIEDHLNMNAKAG